MEKIQVFILEFFDIEAITASLETLFFYPSLEINVLENKSDSTDSVIKPYLINLVKKKKIKRYFAFDKNIFNGVTDIALKHPLINLIETEYCIVTDGSLSCQEPTWLQKQLQLMEEIKNAYICAVSIDTSNMPKGCRQEDYLGHPSIINKGDYEIIGSGHTNGHMLLIKSADLIDTLKFFGEHKKTITDCSFGAYKHAHRNRIWLRVKTPLFHRHTWDYFKVPNHPYLAYKTNFNMERRFAPMRCGYTIYTEDNEMRFDTPEIGV